MSEPKYDHLSLAEHNGRIILITGIEQKSSESERWYHFSGRDAVWHYSGKVLDAANPRHPKFTGEVKDIPEPELSPLPEDERITTHDRTLRL